MKGRKLAGIQITILLILWLLPQFVSAQIVINEIMYNPNDDKQDTDAKQEWIELFNTTDQEQDVGGWIFSDALGTTFTLPGGTTIPANGYLILARNDTEFTIFYTSDTPQYPIPDGVQVLDWGGVALNNDGAPADTLTLENASSTVIDRVSYDDGGSWVTEPDGDGPSLEKINPLLANTNTNADASNWAASTVDYGTPGRINTVTPEPSTIALFATGLFLGLWYRRRLKKRRKR